jgi:diguanylate cyclase (GGDEF)-like protein
MEHDPSETPSVNLIARPASALCGAAALWFLALGLLHALDQLGAPSNHVAMAVAYGASAVLLLLLAWQWPTLVEKQLADAAGMVAGGIVLALMLLPVALQATPINTVAIALLLAGCGIWVRHLVSLFATLLTVNIAAIAVLISTQGASWQTLNIAMLWLSASVVALATRHFARRAERLAEAVSTQQQRLAMERKRQVERSDLEAKRRQQLEKRLAGLQSQLEKSLRTDPLTGVGNRQAFNETLLREFRRARREQQAIALLFCSIDAFRSFNLRLGNDAGDALIKRIAKLVASCIGRPCDLVTRYEGTVFALVLPNTDVAQARIVGNRIRSQVEAENIPHPGSPAAQHVTVSIGLSSAVPYADLSPERLMALAAAALNDAKEQGRNRVHVEAVSAVEEIEPAMPRSPRQVIPPKRG